MKNDKDLHYKSATELVAALADRKISSTELLEETISRIEIFDKKINAIPVRDFERARAIANAADAAIAEGKRLPLLGLPMTVKESFNIFF
jgi:amidase